MSDGRIFGLDFQLLGDAVFVAINVFILFMVLSKILFEPARKMLENRKAKIKLDKETAETEKEQAIRMKKEYEEKLANIDKQADQILAEARKKALKREDEIVNTAQQEAHQIIQRANKEIELEKKKVQDEVKQQIVEIATVMAEKIIATSIDTSKQNALIDETLKEMGDNTWLS